MKIKNRVSSNLISRLNNCVPLVFHLLFALVFCYCSHILLFCPVIITLLNRFSSVLRFAFAAHTYTLLVFFFRLQSWNQTTVGRWLACLLADIERNKTPIIISFNFLFFIHFIHFDLSVSVTAWRKSMGKMSKMQEIAFKPAAIFSYLDFCCWKKFISYARSSFF